MTNRIASEILESLHAGEMVPHDALDHLPDSERDGVIDELIDDRAGRRWLRDSNRLDSVLADRLLEYEDDFQARHRDATLSRAVRHASHQALNSHSRAIAAGPAAQELWRQLAGSSDELLDTAIATVRHGTRSAGETTLHLLVLDPVESHGLDESQRARIARAALASHEPSVRGLAAEHLASHDPPAILDNLEQLIRDEDERVRGFAWSAAYRDNPREAYEIALDLLGDESAPVPQYRSALIATGEHMPTGAITELLAFFVVHPDPELATDAANLLYRLHRHPDIATAASQSPHENVRETAAMLLDPYRGSPAAGGSRPGDPTRSQGDAFAEMLRKMGVDPDETTDEGQKP